MRESVNALATKNNELIEIYNANVDAQNNIFGDVEYDKGVYQSKTINIYQYEDRDDLRNLLAHEMGHALGIDHVEGEQSIMYYLTTDENMHMRKLGENDISALEDLCEVEIW